MTNEQAISVMRTTAIQNATINNAAGVQIVNPTAGQLVQVPDDRNGWGTVSLRYAMNGPGQFTGHFAVNTQGQNDTWSNNISDVAIRARKAEDQAEAASVERAQGREGVERHAAACAAAGAGDCRRPAGVLRQRRRQRLHRVHGRHGARGGARHAGLRRQPDQVRRRHADAARATTRSPAAPNCAAARWSPPRRTPSAPATSTSSAARSRRAAPRPS